MKKIFKKLNKQKNKITIENLGKFLSQACEKKIMLNIKNGFTIVEFIVVISIFAIMTSISMVNYNEQRATIETSNLAETIALTIRQAQVYGISASGYNLGGEDFLNTNTEDDFFDADAAGIADIVNDKAIRGVIFDIGNNEIILYEDNNRDFIYREDDDRIIDKRKIVSRSISFQPASLCNNGTCTSFNGGVIDITFKRPYPDAIIRHRNSITDNGGDLFSSVDIVVGGADSAFKYVRVNSIGNISVKTQ